MEILQTTWFILLIVLLSMFFIMGGFDFGVGILMPFIKKQSRDFSLKQIFPYWDANQVWLITAVGALFAAFPLAYSTILSMLYLPVMILLLSLVLRVISIEFCIHADGRIKSLFINILFLTSTLSAFLIGAILASIFTGSLLIENINFLNLINISAGILTLCFFANQGAGFLYLRRDNFFDYAYNCRRICVFACYCFVAILLFCRFRGVGFLPFVLLLAPAFFLSFSTRILRREFKTISFILSSVFVLLMMFSLAYISYPYIVFPADATTRISVADSSSQTTLFIMLIVALVGVPLALAYTAYAHFILRKTH